MERNLIINKIHTVCDGEFNPGIVKKKNVGRYSDCFVYFLYGEAEYFFDGYSFVADSKSFIYLAKDSIYDIKISDKSKFIFIDFDFNSCDKPRNSSAFNNISPSLKNEFLKIFHIWNNKSPWYIPQAFSAIYNLYTEAIKSENKEYIKKNELFSKISSFIFEHYTESDFSVPAIADYINISEMHLRRIFKQTLNISPIKYINFLKLEKAKNMLIASNFTVAEVAHSAGFEDPYYFSRLFKKEMGISPSEYRKINDG